MKLFLRTVGLPRWQGKESACSKEIWFWSLGREDPLERGMATHSCILAWRIPGQRSLVGYSPWDCRVRHDWASNTLTFHFLNWKPSDVKSWLTGKDSDAGKDRRQEEKRVAEDEMVRQHHWLSGHESEQTLGDSGGQRSLVCYRVTKKQQKPEVQGLRPPSNAGGAGFDPWSGNQDYTPHSVACRPKNKFKKVMETIFWKRMVLKSQSVKFNQGKE